MQSNCVTYNKVLLENYGFSYSTGSGDSGGDGGDGT